MLACFLASYTFGFQLVGGCGGLNLSAPTGGAAKGTPRNLLTDLK